jgi:UDP-3-O-[3-hydroxymyristoyl] glucosamine N-acyltransferase
VYHVIRRISDYGKLLDDPNNYFIFAIHQVQHNFTTDGPFESLKISVERCATVIHRSCVILEGAIIEPSFVILGQSYVSKSHIRMGTLIMPGVIVSQDAVIGP